MRESAQIRPLDREGRAAADGKIGVLSVGMSNTTQEFSRFMQEAARDPQKPPRVFFVDGAQGGQTGARWADAGAPLWTQVDERLARAGVSAAQIQVAWMKQAEAGPARLGDFPKHTDVLRENLVTVLGHLKKRFPNLRLVYLSSRIYAGYATTAPQPGALRLRIRLRGAPADSRADRGTRGPELRSRRRHREIAAAPLGAVSLGRRHRCEHAGRADLRAGRLRARWHASRDTGRAKVARLLLDFLKTDVTAQPWFVAPAAAR